MMRKFVGTLNGMRASGVMSDAYAKRVKARRADIVRHDKRRCERRKESCTCFCDFCVRFHDE